MTAAYIAPDEKEKFFSLAHEMQSDFASESFASLSEQPKAVGIYLPDGQLIGGCLVEESNLKNFRYVGNPAFAGNCGFFLKNKAEQEAKRNSFEKAALDALADFLIKLEKPLVDVSFPHELKDAQPFQWKKFRVEPAYTYRLQLSRAEEELWAGISSNRKNRIRKLEKEGATSRSSSDPQEILSCMKDRFAQKGFGMDLERAEKIITGAIESNIALPIIIENNNEIVAVAFGLHLNDTVYYLFGGTQSGSSDLGASLALWELIKASKVKRAKYFDFEGSQVPGIEQFFRSFGGELTEYRRIKKASLWMEGLLRVVKKGYWS